MLREYQEEINRLKSMLDGKDGDIAGEKVGLVMYFHETASLHHVHRSPCLILTQNRDEQAPNIFNMI